MKIRVFEMLHSAADRLALEASRNVGDGKEADCYIKNHKKVMSYLISEYEENKVTDD
jgi:hypothetical protein